jgi:hypothetical protein
MGKIENFDGVKTVSVQINENFYMKPSTVKEIIEKLQQLPQDLPCYVRPKYWGTLKPYYDAPININGISEMEPIKFTEVKEHVTFLV